MKKTLFIALLLLLCAYQVNAQFPVFHWSQGGTNNGNAPSTNAIIYFDGTRYTATSSQPLYVGSLFATSSSLTSTFSGGVAITGLTSALILTDGNGLLAEYAGTSCVNQFVRSLSVLGAATCATVSASDVSLANLTATDATLTFSGTYNGSVARTIGINLANPNSWTGLQQFANASSTLFSVTNTAYFGGTATSTFDVDGILTLINSGLHVLDTNASHDLIITPGSDLGADRILTLTTGDAARTITLSGNPTLADWFDQNVKTTGTPTFTTVSASGGTFTNATSTTKQTIPVGASVVTPIAGNIAIDTTTGQLRYSQTDGTTNNLVPYYITRFSYATTSQGSGTTTKYLGPAPANITVQSVKCDFSNFLGISLYDGTNRADYFVASSTIGTTTYSTNNAFTWGETMRVDIGTSTATNAAVTGGCTFKYIYDSV